MSPLLLLLIVVQAALLLWAAIHLSEACLRQNKVVPLLWGAAALALPLAMTKYFSDSDPHRMLCSIGDCLVLAIAIGGVRIFAVSRESERFMQERELAARAAAEAAEAERRAEEAERIKAATAALEARKISDAEKARAPAQTARHNTTPILRGGVRSPRFPVASKK